MSGFFESIADLVNTLFKNVFWYTTQKRYERVVLEYSWCLKDVPDHFKTQEMRERAVEEKPYTLEFVPDQFKTQEMCKKVVEEYPNILCYIPDHLNTKKMCKQIIPLFIKTPKNIFSYGVSQHDKNSTYTG